MVFEQVNSSSTKNSKVEIPQHLLEEYPNEMTIVLQNQYWNLSVKKNNFSVALSFNKKKETLIIPFNAITKFYDPFVKFSIQLELKEEKGKTDKEKKAKKSRTTKIITLDDFRKKNDWL